MPRDDSTKRTAVVGWRETSGDETLQVGLIDFLTLQILGIPNRVKSCDWALLFANTEHGLEWQAAKETPT